MTNTINLIAGIFLACVLFAGIPAVSAADTTPQQVSGYTPAPTGTPVTALTVLHAQAGSATPSAQSENKQQVAQQDPLNGHPVNATAGQAADQKNREIPPAPSVTGAVQDTSRPAPAASAPVTTVAAPAPAPVTQPDTGAQVQGSHNDQQGTANQKVTAEKVLVHRNP